MQAEANILERITQAYVAQRGVRLFCVLAVPVAALLLFVLAGGFPPYAWRLLAQTLPQIAALLAIHSSATLLALAGLLLLSLTILLAWWTLLWLSWRMLAYWWYERQELRDFAADLAEAQYQAEDATQYLEDELDEENAFAYQPVRSAGGGRGYHSAARRKVIYPLMPLEPAGQDEEYSYQDDEDAEDEENYNLGIYREEEEEEEDEMRKYQEEDFWEEQNARSVSAPAQPLRPVRLVNAPTYDPLIIEHPGPVASPDNIRHSSYGRVVPFSAAPSVGALPHLTSAPYTRVPLPLPKAPTPAGTPGAAVPPKAPLPMSMVPTAPLSRAPAPNAKPEPAVRQPATQFVVSTGLDVGLKRKGRPNEDSLLALQNTRVLRGCSCPVGLFVVADGMGGHENGQEASHLVIQSLSKTVVPSIIYGPTDDNYAELLAEGVHHANLEVYQRNRQTKADMGTTIAAALVVDTTAYVVSAGDSRVYLYRASSGLSQVTRDHSTVARLIENGLIQPEDIYTHPRRNEIYRSLGHHPSEDLDKFILALQPEDILLLCSDGLWEMVRDAQIQQIIASTHHQPSQISASLVQAALDGGGKDNISVIIVYIKALTDTRTACAG